MPEIMIIFVGFNPWLLDNTDQRQDPVADSRPMPPPPERPPSSMSNDGSEDANAFPAR